MDHDDSLDKLRDAPSQDRTLYTRTTRAGVRTDFEIRETTSWEKTYPEVTRETRMGPPLLCGHHVTKDNQASYCVLCGEAHCSRCERACERCRRPTSPNCCGRQYEGTLFCKPCRRVLRVQKAIRICLTFLLTSFLEDARR